MRTRDFLADPTGRPYRTLYRNVALCPHPVPAVTSSCGTSVDWPLRHGSRREMTGHLLLKFDHQPVVQNIIIIQTSSCAKYIVSLTYTFQYTSKRTAAKILIVSLRGFTFFPRWTIGGLEVRAIYGQFIWGHGINICKLVWRCSVLRSFDIIKILKRWHRVDFEVDSIVNRSVRNDLLADNPYRHECEVKQRGEGEWSSHDLSFNRYI